jgi:hypothetical protein
LLLKASFYLEFSTDSVLNPGNGRNHLLTLFGLATSRFIEDELADIDRSDKFAGPMGCQSPIVEIHCTTCSVPELAVESLASDFLGV